MSLRLVLTILAVSMAVDGLNLIPKIVWTYAPDADIMSVLQQLCIDNLRNYAE